MPLIILFLPPYLAFLYILYVVCKLKKAKPIHCYAIFFIIAIMGIYWFPWGDSQSHFAYYYSDIVEKYYSSYLIASTYWLYDLVIAKIANQTGNYTWGYFFWLLVPLWLFIYAIKQNVQEEKLDWRLFIYLFLFLGIREYLDLSRCTTAFLMFITSILLFKKNKCLSILCILTSLMLHDAVRFYLIVIPLGYVINKLSNRNIYIIYGGVAVLSVIILNFVLPHLLSERNLNLYLGENWQNSKGVNSGYMYIMGLLNVLIFFIQFVLIHSNRKYISKTLYILFLSSSFVVMCGFSMWVLRERFVILSNIIGASIILTNWHNFKGIYKNSKWRILRYINTTFVLRIVLNLMLLYSARCIHDSATKNNKEEFRIVSHALYMPTFVLFDIDSFGFSDKKYLQLYERVNSNLEL